MAIQTVPKVRVSLARLAVRSKGHLRLGISPGASARLTKQERPDAGQPRGSATSGQIGPSPTPNQLGVCMWTEEKIEALKKRWNEGASYTEIAKQLGFSSRGCISGKVHRLGLRRGHSGNGIAKRRVVASSAKGTKALPAPKREPKPVSPVRAIFKSEPLPPEPAVTKPLLSLLDLENHHCRYPIGTPGQEGFGFCGCKKVAGTPYCETHVRIAYQPVAKPPVRPPVDVVKRNTPMPLKSFA